MNMNLNYIIDRFEEDIAVCEDDNKNLVNIPRKKLPDEAKAGDVIRQEHQCYFIDVKETAERKMRIRRKMDDLLK